MSVGGPARVVKVKSLKAMRIVMDLGGGNYAWWAPRPAVAQDDDDKEEEEQEQQGEMELEVLRMPTGI